MILGVLLFASGFIFGVAFILLLGRPSVSLPPNNVQLMWEIGPVERKDQPTVELGGDVSAKR